MQKYTLPNCSSHQKLAGLGCLWKIPTEGQVTAPPCPMLWPTTTCSHHSPPYNHRNSSLWPSFYLTHLNGNLSQIPTPPFFTPLIFGIVGCLHLHLASMPATNHGHEGGMPWVAGVELGMFIWGGLTYDIVTTIKRFKTNTHTHTQLMHLYKEYKL